MNLQSIALICSSLGLMILTGCASSPTATAPVTQATASSTSQPIATPTPSDKKERNQAGSNQGGIVVESGPYHLELVPEKDGANTHLDLFVQKGDTHEAISDAKVTVQVQLPDGSQQSVVMTYDLPAKHYAGTVATVAAGDYKLTAQAEIAGEKVNARFNFKQ
jgi:hypothetical protein